MCVCGGQKNIYKSKKLTQGTLEYHLYFLGLNSLYAQALHFTLSSDLQLLLDVLKISYTTIVYSFGATIKCTFLSSDQTISLLRTTLFCSDLGIIKQNIIVEYLVTRIPDSPIISRSDNLGLQLKFYMSLSQHLDNIRIDTNSQLSKDTAIKRQVKSK